jgi:hypothetical protein
MPEPQDIDRLLRHWPFEAGMISARLVPAQDGREVLQMRIEMGILQMETSGRPDGEKPGGAATYLDFLKAEAVRQPEPMRLTEEQTLQVDREFYQYYHRRVCWLALREFARAVVDADHTLALMDFVQEYSSNEEWVQSHEQYRPFVLFHRTQAVALDCLEKTGAEAAIEEINQGLERMRRSLEGAQAEEPFEEDELVVQLHRLQAWLREQYDVGRTLAEQLADAVAHEQYEVAARLRDEIAKRSKR